MTEADIVLLAEEKGLRDGGTRAPYSPPTTWQVVPDADDAYRSAYFHALAYQVFPDRRSRDFPENQE